MVEGVIAVDKDQRIIAINKAAVQLFSLKKEPESGTWIGAILRNVKINEFIKHISSEGEEMEDEMVLPAGERHNEGERFLKIHGNALSDAAGKTIGALVVINDLTRLKKLETMRSDFVANVSHELRTPLTSIKGFVETLQAGALDDHDEAQRFLHIIARQVDRLSTIVEDLLVLSRIEEDAHVQGAQFQKVNVADVVSSAVLTCSMKAKTKKITINQDCDSALTALIEPALIEEAIINLLDNAVNYSPSNGNVSVNAKLNEDKSELQFIIADNGTGIPEIHHERIFERFYRVDKARSRKLGGTGLGLSIVKHVAIIHKGNVTLDSASGKGSTFTIHVPYKEISKEEV
jgi:two-component system phosphate regulon sensor histidine kinase PhoR